MKHPIALFLKTCLAAFVAAASVQPLGAQNTADWETYFEQLTAMEDAETADWENAYEVVSQLAAHPLDINSATRDDLERIPFLSDTQIAEICEYLDRYGRMQTLGELMIIESLDAPRRQLLSCLLVAGAEPQAGFPQWRNILKYGEHQLIATAKIPTYQRRGDQKGYLGWPYRHDLRYQFSYGQYVKAGITGAQDSGEPFLAGRNRAGYDYYSAYLMVRRLGRLKAAVVGRYRLKAGLGLVINNDFSLGKLAMLSQMTRQQGSLRAHSSRSEGNYLQGAAATIALSKAIDLTAFASYRAIDATLGKDSSAIRTILTSGYHRTESEMRRKHNAHQWLAGASLHLRKNGFHAGLTAVATGLDRELKPQNGQLYRQIYASGQSFWNASVDYGYTSRRLSVSGETATGSCHGVATLNMLRVALTDRLDMMGLWRMYSYRYYSLVARSFSDGGSVQNESGGYVGLNWRATRRLTFTAYSDYAQFAWPRYQMEANAHSWDNMLTVTWQQGPWTAAARYRWRQREHQTTQRARLSLMRKGTHWTLKTQGDLSVADGKTGWMVSQQAGFRSQKWLVAGVLGWFRTDDFSTRVYCYERGMLYSFGFQSYYGHGIRYSLLAQYAPSRRLALMAKAGTTNYFDRSTVGTGLQQVAHSSLTDVELQLRWRF
ncbi:MAG: helix-hairpin-helix domain-containing protein [Prevotella sp.]|nr:helix-hairpin-helix domain-containing protein [Prevotella sp.]